MLFASPDLLWQAACEYFDWCDKHPWVKNEAVKSGDSAGLIIQVPTSRPYTIAGLLLYIGVNDHYWRDFRSDGHREFEDVIARVEKVIETQQFEGATVGAFNANIISRKLGLIDKQALTGADGGELRISHEVRNHRVIFEDYTGDE